MVVWKGQRRRGGGDETLLWRKNFLINPKEDQSQAYDGAKNGGSRCLHVERLEGCARKTEQGLEALGRNTHLW